MSAARINLLLSTWLTRRKSSFWKSIAQSASLKLDAQKQIQLNPLVSLKSTLMEHEKDSLKAVTKSLRDACISNWRWQNWCIFYLKRICPSSWCHLRDELESVFIKLGTFQFHFVTYRWSNCHLFIQVQLILIIVTTFFDSQLPLFKFIIWSIFQRLVANGL